MHSVSSWVVRIRFEGAFLPCCQGLWDGSALQEENFAKDKVALFNVLQQEVSAASSTAIVFMLGHMPVPPMAKSASGIFEHTTTSVVPPHVHVLLAPRLCPVGVTPMLML